MDEERKRVWYWWLVCERGCTWEKTAMTTTPDQGWIAEGCPTCAGKYVGQVILAPNVAP